ncbi:MAG: hypothetical protein ACSLEL_02890 [Candidatus Malihini olakiniferum]
MSANVATAIRINVYSEIASLQRQLDDGIKQQVSNADKDIKYDELNDTTQ